MNQSPNQRGRGQRYPSGQQRPQASSQSTPRPPLTPQQIAARRAYIERRRRQIRRNRIMLGIACLIVLLLIIFLVSVIVRGITAVISGGPETTDNVDTSTLVGTMTDTVGSDTAGLSTQYVPGVGPELTQPPEQQEVDLSYEAMAFSSDLKEFEKYMNPDEERDAYLILVNAEHPLSSSDVPSDLVEVTNTRTDRAKQMMRKTAEKALQALYIEAHAQGMMSPDTPSGYPLSVTSAYRSYDTQNYLFSNYTQKELTEHPGWTKAQAEEEVLTYSCRPGTSEHQTGLCCDMHTLTGADVSFADYEQAQWLAENCWKFGYILRFPKDKVEQTGISYEPWHFRYVGRYHAYAIWSQGLCLEEYITQLEG
ncbi:MAG: D-alanyl-D-alanine carboxypeptidase family protein [Ruminococcaceae bacterium]|nr:D-alanyl-D-alanine carboxypeptidase family protein [Oscillospiraceae bacterium]